MKLTKLSIPILWALTSVALVARSSRLLPDQLHCSSLLYLTTWQPDDDSLKWTSSSGAGVGVEKYQIEEFLDVVGNRSSISVYDTDQQDVKIYYNQLSPYEGGDRQFLAYDPLKVACRQQRIGDWPLTVLRQLVISMHDSPSDLKRSRVDVPLGPSALLFAIEDNLDSFKYKATVFSKSRLTDVDVYTKQFSFRESAGWRHLSVVVHLISRGQKYVEAGDTMDKAFEVAQTPEGATEPASTSMPVALVAACEGHVDLYDLLDDDDEDKPKAHEADVQVDAISYCQTDRLLFTIHYGIIDTYAPGTLVGTSLGDPGDQHAYDFRREPFARPVGMGCWNARVADPDWQVRLTPRVAVTQLSAEYITQYDTRGVAYLAYDQARHLLRHDRRGRKSVYDLLRAKSYHVGEFSTVREAVYEQGASASDRSIEQCVVLDIVQEEESVGIVQQYLGIDETNSDYSMHYVGSRMLDHVNYEVFEREIKWLISSDDDEQIQVPVVLQTSTIRLPLFAADLDDKRLFVTYYATHLMTSGALVLRFMELWEFDIMRHRKRLVNRVKFVEFSWRLDVEPSNDPTSGQRVGPLALRLFDIEACHQDRAGQAQLVVDFKRNIAAPAQLPASAELLASLRAACVSEGLEMVHRMLAETLEVSHLNIVDLQLEPLTTSGSLISSSRLIELRSGLLDLKSLGAADTAQHTFDSRVQRAFFNRHTLADCQLESLAWPAPNWLAHCPGQAMCLLLDASDELARLLVKGGGAAAGGGRVSLQQRTTCQVYDLKYSSVDMSAGRNVLAQADLNAWQLPRRTLEFTLPAGGQSYRATPFVRSLRPLDSIGGRLKNQAALMQGLRYSTKAEEPQAFNLNQRIVMPLDSRDKSQLSPFRYCQIACQMDPLCGSFSLCSSGNAGDPPTTRNDCVLSSLRLTGERANLLVAGSAQDRKATKFEVKLAGEFESQVFVMYHDDACSLHGKDFLADYEVTKSFLQLGDDSTFRAKSKNGTETNRAQVKKRHLSLDDCAGLNYEMNPHHKQQASENFIYCPLESHCIIKAVDNVASQMVDSSAYCYVYAHRPTRAYQVKRMTHLVIGGGGGGGAGSGEKVEPMREVQRMGDSKLARQFWATSEQTCARECNLHKSKCLAFDSCRSGARVLCALFPIRSPLVPVSAYLPQLKVERSQSDNQVAVSMLSSLICDHYYLRGDYFQVRLRHLLLTDENPPTQWNELENNPEKQKRERELEEQIESEDKRTSDEIEEKLEQEIAKEEPGRDQLVQGTSNSLIHLIPLLLGLLVGALACAYRQPISLVASGALASIKTHLANRQQQQRDDLNRLTLDNPL